MVRCLTLLAGLVLLAGCVTAPPPDPITVEEVVHLGRGAPGGLGSGAQASPALIQALETRPLGFPLTYETLKDLEARGVSPQVIDTVVAYSVEKRARAIAPHYSTYDPYWYPWPYTWHFGFGYNHYSHRCR